VIKEVKYLRGLSLNALPPRLNNHPSMLSFMDEGWTPYPRERLG